MSRDGLDPDEREALFRAGADAWEEFRRRRGDDFHAFVPGDYALTYEALLAQRERADTFLELGSGVGVITILAARLGYQAYGIEMDPWLVERAEALAEEFGADATFVQGSYVPDAAVSLFETAHDPSDTVGPGAPAYGELGLELADFDLVYVFPWPETEELHAELLERHMRPGAARLFYGDIEGCRATVIGAPEATGLP